MRMKHKFFVIIFLFWAPLFASEVEKVYLKTPDLSQESVTGWAVGVRPYRKSGVRIEAETWQDRLIIHNYGYGGSGLSLAFGGAQEVQDLLHQSNIEVKRIAVLGSGVIGLATAYELAKEGYDVTIYADAFSPHLTSDIATGFWSPPVPAEKTSIEQKQLVERLTKISRERLLQMANGEFLGVRWISLYRLQMDDQNRKPSHFAHTERLKTSVEIHFDNGTVKMGLHYVDLAIDGKIFMQDLVQKTESMGVRFEERHFRSKEDLLLLPETVLINCMSLGSREIFNDDDFMPIRGHLVYIKPQEGVDYALSQSLPHGKGYWVNLCPWEDRLIVGGVFEFGKEDLEADPLVIETLLQNIRNCLK
jgi:D-amino-acid oxidase